MKPAKSAPEECESSVKHFKRVLALAENLASLGIRIRGHHYEPHFFGMWEIIAGSFNQRWKFLWDDRDQILFISKATFNEFGSIENDWIKISDEDIDARRGVDPFLFVERFLKTRY